MVQIDFGKENIDLKVKYQLKEHQKVDTTIYERSSTREQSKTEFTQFNDIDNPNLIGFFYLQISTKMKGSFI
jgi:hypothetical protein